MRILEFRADHVSVKDVVTALEKNFKLERVGGASRVYLVGGSELGVVYLVDDGPKAVGISWERGSNVASRVFIWNMFNALENPSIEASLPAGAPIAIIHSIVEMVKHPYRGIVESAAGTRDISLVDFLTLLHDGYSGNISAISGDELSKFAMSKGVVVPAEIINDPDLHAVGHTPAHPLYDLSRVSHDEKQERVHLVARASGAIFTIPGVDTRSKAIDHAFAEEQGSAKSMDEQYEELKEKVKLVASNRSQYIKSLLITGAPSSGKTFTVMQTIKALGLIEGSDYIVIKGSITDAALYLTFIEKIDALTIFDDCDSVAETKDGKNMLKNALDTYPVRDIGRPNANSTNTKHMSTEEREEFVNAVSRILRGEPAPGDLDRFDHYLPSKKANEKKKDEEGNTVETSLSQFLLPDDEHVLDSLDNNKASDEERLHALQSYFKRRPPNRIDFKGRIIFISNMDETDWDSAILTRAFRQNMNFADNEMLDFIEKIKHTIPAPGLTDTQKNEVLDYLRELHDKKLLKSRINFRLVQQCFDLRLCGPWKRMMSAL